jgi:hypothetical protein
MERHFRRTVTALGVLAAGSVLLCRPSLGDGMLKGPASYRGSLEEHAQEAIIIFQASTVPGEAVEDLILKIAVEGEAAGFAWVIPFPRQPDVDKADPRLFQELFDYVSFRERMNMEKKFAGAGGFLGGPDGVDVLARKIVGTYEVAVVRENSPGALNEWLRAEGYQTITEGEDVVEFYRKKEYVFVCVKVSDAALKAKAAVDLHPLRFSFKTGGRDGIYFPMKLTGLQRAAFDVNLYVFYQAWLNDGLNQYGYEHRGFRLKHRDWDSPKCTPNAGKDWSRPALDPFLRDAARRIHTVADFLQKSHPGKRFYLTNIQAHGLKPDEVRQWPDDLWLFPYYVRKGYVPRDALPGGPACAAYTRGTDRPNRD